MGDLQPLDMSSIADLSNQPRFTIKMVCAQTGIRAVTLRAWERRHGLITPHRSDNRYRLYSERDIAILLWIKNQVDNGIPISSAANALQAMIKNGNWPEAIDAPEIVEKNLPNRQPEMYINRLYTSLINRNEGEALDLLREASSSLNLITYTTRLLIPVLQTIGDDWYQGKISISTEHFASGVIRGRLLSLLQSTPINRSGTHILIGCGPEEHHEIGSLIFSLLLRERKYRVEFLGPDLPVDDLVEYASLELPDMIILSSTIGDTATRLRTVQSRLNTLKRKCLFGFGGMAFILDPVLVSQMDGIYLGPSIEDGLNKIQELFHPSR